MNFLANQLGQAEIEDFDAAFAGDEDVFGFQIAMDDALVMRSSEALSDGERVFDGAFRGQGTGFELGA